MSRAGRIDGAPARRGLLLVISSPSGAGKTSLAGRLLADQPDLTLSISVTTRAPRLGEQDGREYSFTSREAFDAKVSKAEFLEWAEVHEHRYGTPRAPVMAALAEGRDVLFDIDWQGAAVITAEARADTVSVFILPPTMADLARRLHGRAQDAEAVIQRRLGRAKGEIAHWSEYDYVLLNDDFERACLDLLTLYRAERLRRERNLGLSGFVDGLLGEKV